jgi:hypothetical protein
MKKEKNLEIKALAIAGAIIVIWAVVFEITN